jgi:UDP-glucuronate decarboxylase
MCYIDDFIEGCWQAILRETPTGVYNIGNPYNTMTVNRIAQTVIDVTSSTSDIVYVEKDYIDKQGVTPNIDRAKNHLSYQPQVSLERGIKAMMNECNEGRKVER